MEHFHNQRVAMFVDVSNMYHSAKNLYQANVNFGKILEEATKDRQLIRAFAYAIKSGAKEEEQFFERLEKQGFEVRLKDLQIFFGGAKKGDWDVGLTVEAIRLARKLDVIVLVTGDGDFVSLVEYLQEHDGARVEVMAFQKTTSAKLIEAADEFVDLGANKKKFLLH